jgi:hypothetical protein
MGTPTDALILIEDAQELLGVSRTTLWRLLKKHEIETFRSPEDERQRGIRACDLRKLRDREVEAA